MEGPASLWFWVVGTLTLERVEGQHTSMDSVTVSVNSYSDENSPQSRICVSLKMLVPHLYLVWLFTECTGCLWDDVGSAEERMMTIVVVYLFRKDVLQLFRQHHVPNWEFNFQLVD